MLVVYSCGHHEVYQPAYSADAGDVARILNHNATRLCSACNPPRKEGTWEQEYERNQSYLRRGTDYEGGD